jgi:hypothetical protein
MSRRVVLVLLAMPWLLLALITSAARAAPGDRFSAVIAPDAVQPLAGGNYALAITNLGSSPNAANNTHVVVPDGFIVDGTSLSASTSAHGSCSAATWVVALDQLTSTIDASAPLDPESGLCPGATLTVTFVASSPAVEAPYFWTTTLFTDASPFTLQGGQPTVTVDGTAPPPPDLASTPPDPSNSSAATFAFSDDDPEATFVCELDGGAPAACPSPSTYTSLGEGAHTFAVKAVDPAGNQSTATSYAWTIDVTPPPPPTITSAPPNVTDSTTATFSFSDADGSATFRCKLDGGSFSACASPVTYTNLAEGEHTFEVKAVDPAGNQSTVTSHTWFIDLTNPVVTVDPASEPHDPTNQASASFVFTSNKAGSTFECRLDGGQFSPCTSPKAYSGLADGRRSFGVRATDSLGHVGLATVYEWTIDTTPPATTITSEPTGVTSSHSATFAFASSEAPSSFACSLDGGGFGPCVSPKSYGGLADGQHAFQVRATDVVGNTDPTPAAYSWQVVTPVVPDTTPPGTVLELRRRVGYGLLRLAWSLPTDPDFDHVEVVRSRGAKGAARAVVYEGSAAGYTEKRFRNGTYYRYEVRSYDHAGNVSPGVGVVVPRSVLLRSPRDGAVVRLPPLLRWAGVPRASYYNVQVYRGSRKVLSAWPLKAKLKMRRSWVYQGHRFPFRKGVYHWWVWPAFGPRSKAAYGQLLGTGRFVVR